MEAWSKDVWWGLVVLLVAALVLTVGIAAVLIEWLLWHWLVALIMGAGLATALLVVVLNFSRD